MLLNSGFVLNCMKVAFDKVKITPADGVIGKPLAGYTPIPLCTGKLDDIYAHVAIIEGFVLDQVKKRLVLISLDFLKVPLLFTDYVKEKIQDEYKIHPDQVLIHAIHTHKSLDMGGEFVWPGGYPAVFRSIMFGAYHSDDKYKVWITRKIVQLIGNMLESLQPARMAWDMMEIEDDILINRRHPTRYSKSNLGLISFKDKATGEIIGIIVTFGMHPTTLANVRTKLSADYPGRLVHKVEELSDGKFSAVFFTAPCGDLNPVTTCGTDFEYLDSNRQPVYGQLGTYEDTKRLGYFLGEKAYKGALAIPDEKYFKNFGYKSFSKVFWVPMDDYKKIRPKNWPWSKLVHLIKRWFLLKVALTLADVEEPNFPGFAIKHRGWDVKLYSFVHYIEISAWNGGDDNDTHKFSIVGIPGELFEDYAKEIVRESPTGENTFIIENANDWIGYLFPLKEYLEGGYEPVPSFSPKGGEYVMDAYHELLEDIKLDITGGYS